MKIVLIIVLAGLSACVNAPETPQPDKAYWDALNGVPGARTGEADYYYTHGGNGGFSAYGGWASRVHSGRPSLSNR